TVLIDNKSVAHFIPFESEYSISIKEIFHLDSREKREGPTDFCTKLRGGMKARVRHEIRDVWLSIELSRSKVSGVTEHSDESPFQRRHPPNVLIGGPVPISPGFPIGTFGNDGFKEVWNRLVGRSGCWRR